MNDQTEAKKLVQELDTAAREARIAWLEQQRNFFAWGVIVLSVALVIVLATS